MRFLSTILILFTLTASAQTNRVQSGQRVMLGDKVSNYAGSAITNNLYTNYVATANRANFSGLVGMIWTNNSEITVTALGRWVTVSNQFPRTILLVKWSDKSTVASCILNSSNSFEGVFIYTNISPVVLSASTVYALCSAETNGITAFQDGASGSRGVFSSGQYGGAAFSVTYLPAGLTYDAKARPYGPLDLKYTP